MIYNIDKNNYKDFSIIERNKLSARSYFIPYPDKTAALAVSAKEKRYSSPLVRVLSGVWDFKFFHNPKELPDVFDTDKIAFDKLDVPASWQFRGYDRPFYVNLRYQFPYKPPFIPAEEKMEGIRAVDLSSLNPIKKFPAEDEYNFVGVYRTFFDLDKKDGRQIISFLGVASCLDLYLNGSFVGYSEGSHNTAEFDLTDFLVVGKNELVAVVHRWCNGSYLECQDMFRNNGIFRDVLLRFESASSVKDLAFTSEKTDGEKPIYAAAVEIKLAESAETSVKVSILGESIKVEKTVTVCGAATVCFDNLEVKEWTSETPSLYDLIVETPTECVCRKIGFKTITVHGTDFLINGKRVKLKGVNHHDSTPTNGYTMTPDEIERDLSLCKEYNVNTVRTSHYPPDPLFLELCDEMGLYVVDEGDLETHGVTVMKLPPSMNWLSNNPAWISHYVDRAKRLFERDKLHASIIMWSLGNESGGGVCTDKMYEYLKTVTAIPVHYESVIHSRRKAYDIASEMYPSVKHVHEVGEKTAKTKQLVDRPYFMCEYAHAMGVGPGAIEEYWKEIYSHDNLIGGCIWEMLDHAVLHEDGSYTYGGDHGEFIHDGNFCVDGLFYPDRTPSTGAKLAKFTYRPIRASLTKNRSIELFNTTSFTRGDNFEVSLTSDFGDSVTLSQNVAPLERVTVELPDKLLSARRINVVVTDKSTGRTVSTEQLEIKGFESPAIEKGDAKLLDGVSVDNGRLSITLDGVTIASGDPATILFRAPTDNDKGLILGDVMKHFVGETDELLGVERFADRIVVTSRQTAKKNTFLTTDVFEAANGGIMVTSAIHSIKGKYFLPRFGKAFSLDANYDDVEYFGRNGESYIDMQDHTQIEKVNCKVADMTEPNIKPQESGNRTDTEYVVLSDGKHKVKFTAIDKPFELSVKGYSDRALLSMKHRKDEIRTGTFVTVNAFQMGIGTGSCGPTTLDKFKYPVNRDYTLKFLITIE